MLKLKRACSANLHVLRAAPRMCLCVYTHICTYVRLVKPAEAAAAAAAAARHIMRQRCFALPDVHIVFMCAHIKCTRFSGHHNNRSFSGCGNGCLQNSCSVPNAITVWHKNIRSNSTY